MARFGDSDDYAQFDDLIAPGQYLGSEHMSTYYPHVPFNPPRAFGDSRSNNTLTAQYNYPPPSFADNYRQHPYPDPSVRTSEQIAACLVPGNAHMDSFWTQRYRYPDNPTIAPNQTLQHDQDRDDIYTHTRNTTEVATAVIQSTQLAIQSQSQMLMPYLDHAHPQQLSESRTAIRPTADVFRDNSTPYVAGYVAGREAELQRRTEVLSAVAEQPSFACDKCTKKWKSKSDLNHHKVTHDTKRRRRHKCNDCSSAFRYPKDLKRHVDTIHREIHFPCADCDKVYKRKDHLDRHTRSKGHVAAPETALLLPASPTSPTLSTQTSDRSAVTATSRSDRLLPNRSHGFGAQPISHIEQSTLNTDPSLLQVPTNGSASLTNASVDDTSTVSEVESFWSEEFRIV